MTKGLSSVNTLTAREIAKKWELPLAVVAKKIAAGVRVEKEHTKSTRQANEIARDHIGERPDYYEKLDKMEKKPIVKEATDSGVTGVDGVRGLGLTSGTPSGTNYVELYINTNTMSYQDENGNKLDYIKKHHNKHHKDSHFKTFDPTKIKQSSNKDLAESLGSDYGTTAVPVIGDLTGASRKMAKEDSDPCWKGYQMVGMKKKKGRKVPNCVPVEEQGSPANPARDTERPMYEKMDDEQRMEHDKAYLASLKRTKRKGLKHPRLGQTVKGRHITGLEMKMSKKRMIDVSKLEEATYKGKTVTLNKPMKGDVKKSKVFVDPDGDGKAQKINFGDKNLSIKKNQPGRKKSYCSRSGGIKGTNDKTSANYWSRRAWDCEEETQITEAEHKKLSYDDFTKGRIDLKKATPEQHREMGRRSKKAGVGGSQWHFKKAKEKENKVNEEQIDEISGSLASRYIIKAREQKKDIQSKSNKDLATIDDFRKGIHRKKGIETAWNKLTGKAKVHAKEETQIDEISAELVGKVSNARWRRGEAPSKTLSRAINKKFIESGKKKEDDTPFEGSHKRSHEKSSTHVKRLARKAMEKYTTEETTMDTKELINEALDNILEENLVAMKENLQAALQEKMMEKLEERKKNIAADYFAQ